MSQQTINIGTVPNDHTGDTLRVSFTKVNENFAELYSITANTEPYLLKANNLFGLANVSQARTNLGLGNLATANVPGSNAYVLFNDSGSVNAVSSFAFDKSRGVLALNLGLNFGYGSELLNDASNQLVVRNYTASSRFAVAGNYTDSSTRDLLVFDVGNLSPSLAWIGLDQTVGSISALTVGLGADDKAFTFSAGGISINYSTMYWNNDGFYDLGGSNFGRPRNIYIANSIAINSLVINTTALATGTTVLDTSGFVTGNSTVNTSINSTTLFFRTSTSTANLTASRLSIGNSTVNAVINSTSFYLNGGTGVINCQDMTVGGNLVVTGTLISLNATNLTVADSMIKLANGNSTSDLLDIGLYGSYGNSTVTKFTGLFRDATDGYYALFRDLQSEPSTTVNISGTGYGIAALRADLISSNVAISGGSVANISSNFTFATDNTYDIGASGANRPRNAYIGNTLTVQGITLCYNGLANVLSFGGAADVQLTRDAADVLALRRSTNQQQFNVYNTYTDSSNYEVGYVKWEKTTTSLWVGTDKAGTGVTRYLRLIAGGQQVMNMTGSGPSNFIQLNTHLLYGADNTYDFGQSSSAFRPRTGYFGTSVVIGTSGTTFLSGLQLSLLTNSATARISMGTAEDVALYRAAAGVVNMSTPTGNAVFSPATINLNLLAQYGAV